MAARTCQVRTPGRGNPPMAEVQGGAARHGIGGEKRGQCRCPVERPAGGTPVQPVHCRGLRRAIQLRLLAGGRIRYQGPVRLLQPRTRAVTTRTAFSRQASGLYRGG